MSFNFTKNHMFKTQKFKSIGKSFLSTRSKGVASIPELAVILIILGLMVSAFATFSKIIGIAKANSIIKDYTTLNDAVSSFKATYSFVPGDAINASSILQAGEQDGNGDGLVSWGNSSTAANASANESLNFFKHLKAAGMLPNISPSAIASTTDAKLTGDQNIFKSNIQGAGFIPVSFNVATGYKFDSSANKNSFTLVLGQFKNGGLAPTATELAGATTVSTGKIFDTGATEVDILKSVDSKIDDESSASGIFKYNASDALPIAGFSITH